MPRTLDNVAVSKSIDGFLIEIEDDDGETTEFAASHDQLALLMDELEKILDDDEAVEQTELSSEIDVDTEM